MDDLPTASCLFCGQNAKYQEMLRTPGGEYDLAFYECSNCGRNLVDWDARNRIQEEKSDIAFRLACILREHRLRGEMAPYGLFDPEVPPIDENLRQYIRRAWSVDELLSEFPKATEIMDRSLCNLSRLVKRPMEHLSPAWCQLSFLVFCQDNELEVVEYLEQMGFVTKYSATNMCVELSIAPGGWKRIAELSTVAPDSKQSFVAMWFSDDMEAFYRDAIEPAIKKAGYECVRVDLKEHNNKICDEIVAEIRKSRFVVADFTGQRGGVYFEAGYAMGMGVPVIWIVRKDEVDALHFDTRQYNHIVYESAEDLKSKLYNRIAATIH